MSDEKTTPEQESKQVAVQIVDLIAGIEKKIGQLDQTIHLLSNEVERNSNLLESIQNKLLTGTGTQNVNLTQNPDSLTVGAPTNGQIKAYGDFNDTKTFEKKIENAQKLLEKAKG